MVSLSDLKIGAPGPFLPPWENALKNAKTIDALGYDSMVFPDHLAGFVPQSIWIPEVTQLAYLQHSPHTYYELASIMGACAAVTENVQLISSVTEPIRRHPALIAQTFLTLDHISNGRVVLGIGAGEIENVDPYGLNYRGQVGKLREALKIIRHIWENPEPFNFDGKFWKMKDAVMSLRPTVEGKPPPIWIAALGPKMLEITAEYGDGWIPTLLQPKDFGKSLRTIQDLRKKKDIDRKFTAALWNWCILDEDESVCERLMNTDLAKAFALLLPDSQWKKHGYNHPFGEGFHSLTDYVPMRYDKETTMNAINQVPQEILNDFYMTGNAESIIKQLEEYVLQGLDHLVLWNTTGMYDLSKTKSSYGVMKKVLAYVKG